MSSAPLFVVGAGGFGREVATVLRALGESMRPEGFVDDDPSQRDVARVRALGLEVVETVHGLAARREPFAAVIAGGLNPEEETRTWRVTLRCQ